MSWNDSERRRKVVTYGKSARNSPALSRRPLSFSTPDDMHVSTVSAPLRSELQTRPQAPQKSHMHRSKPTSKAPAEKTPPRESNATPQDSQRSLRSPKRRKVSGDHDKQTLQNPDKAPLSKVTASSTTDKTCKAPFP